MDHPASPTRERASILVTLLLLMIPLAGLTAALLTVGSRQSTELDVGRAQTVAFHNAESGLDAAFARLLVDPGDLSDLADTYDDGATLRYLVQFSDLGTDGLDNDGDGLFDEADESKYTSLESAGSLNVLGYQANGRPLTNGGRFHVQRVRAQARSFGGLPPFPYAVYLGDPLAGVVLEGNAFSIDGRDYLADGSFGEEPDVPGIATVGNPQDVIDQLEHQQLDNIVGQDGPPSVHQTTPIDLQSFIDDYKSLADYRFDHYDGRYTGSLGDPYHPTYKITHAIGNLELGGGGSGTHGAGLLLVEGNLIVAGNWEYNGIVIVTGQVLFEGGGGTKKVMGTVLAGGDVTDQTSSDFGVTGTVDIQYSSSIQAAVSSFMPTHALMGWQQL